MAGCPACIQGSLDEGTPRGQEEQLAGVPCYVSRPGQQQQAGAASSANGAGGPAQATRAVILGSDVFGFKLINLRLIADVFAEHGYVAVAPDYLHGTPVDMQVLERASGLQEERNPLRKLLGVLWLVWTFAFKLRPWFAKHPYSYSVQVVKDLAGELKQQHGIKDVVYTGYCFGGTVGISLSGTPGVAEAIAVAHPGPVKDDEIAAMSTPMLFCLAATDRLFPPKLVDKVKAALQEKREASGLFSKVVQHPGTQHGYATRAGKNDTAAQEARKDALQQSLSFFNQVLSGGGGDGTPTGAAAS